MMQYIIKWLYKKSKQSISLILVLTMLFGMTPYGDATETQVDAVMENAVLEASELAEDTDFENTEPEVPENTENQDTEYNEDTAPEITEDSGSQSGDEESDPSETPEGTEPEIGEEETDSPETPEGTVSETTEDEEATEEETTEEGFMQQLQMLESLKDIFDAMMANPEAVYALSLEEIAELKAHVQAMYDAAEEPTLEDTEYYGLILDTLTILEEEFLTPVELLDESVTITHNGSRLFVSGADNCQWQRLGENDEYVTIEGATGTYYDLTAADSETYIRVQVGENTYSNSIEIPIVVVFDIAKGAVSLGTTYSGKNSDGESVSGTHAAENIYIITQKEPAMTGNNIVFSGHLPDAPFDVTLAGVNMGATPTNHNQAPGSSGSGTPSAGEIRIPATSGAVKKVTLRLRGENAVRYISYYNGGDTNNPANVASFLKITDIDGDGAVSGSLYIPKKLDASEIDAFVATKTNYNHWNAGIGGTDGSSLVQNLHIAGGKVQVVTTLGDNCTAIGAGGNGYGEVTITGGEVIAHCNGTGAAIGGGIGWNAAAGKGDVVISGGTVYAENHAKITAAKDGVNHTVGGVAIGSGSTFHSTGSDGTVTITGGTVVAYGAYGNGIGGGNSSSFAGGKATITIKGGNVTANSIGGGNSAKGAGGNADITITNENNVSVRLTKEGTDCDSCGIGGGNSLSGNGGTATITVNGGTIYSDGSIGGGDGGGNNGTGGTATVTVNGGMLNATGSIGGGTGSGSGNGGTATVTVKNGTLNAQSVGGGTGISGDGGDATVTVSDGALNAQSIGGGTGGTNGDGGAAKIVVSGGTIVTGSIGGGGTQNSNGKLGYATADITGGDISGQFLLMAGGTEPCYFKMSGGILHGVDAANDKYTMKDGAAVYMDDPSGTVTISGGTITDCSAANGGAVYMTAGTFTMYDSAVITDCSATENGGAVYLGSSGENKGSFTMEGGIVSNNHADNGNGGAIYLNGGDAFVKGGIIGQTKTTDGEGNETVIGTPNSAQNGGGAYLAGGNLTVSGGAISSNTAAANGGGAYVDGGSVVIYGTAQISGNAAGTNGGGVAVNNGNFSMEGGSIDNNRANNGNGGGIYVSSSSATLVTVDVLSGSVSSNLAGTSGGALAVVGAASNSILVNVGINEEHDKPDPLPHGEHDAYTCPEINGNRSASSGGAIYVTGSKQAKLCIYCMTEDGNVAGDESKPSDFMMVEGGTVEITTEEPNTEEDTQDGKHGHTVIKSPIYVVGGDVDIWGIMTNPDISDVITVDIKSEGDEFDDHRIVGSASIEYYKLLYYENFTDPATGITTGLYRQTRVQRGDTVTISGIMYAHPGYEIRGWNTHPKSAHDLFATHNPDELEEGQSYVNEGWYNCRQDYLFDGTNRNHLTLYAIWEPIGYTVTFEPNAGENGQYTGHMEDTYLTYDLEENLDKNEYGRPGYSFTGWNTKADGSGVSYADEAPVKNLSNKVGNSVPLYAQWTPCDHDPEKHTYTYTATDNVLVGECSCMGNTVTATLIGSDVTYDMDVHKAEVDRVGKVIPDTIQNVVPKYEVFTPPDEGAETEGSWTEMASDKYPVNAGLYRASITVSGQTAFLEYTIRKATQPAPGKPSYLTNKDNPDIGTDQLVVNEVAESGLVKTDITDEAIGKIGYDSIVEYAVVYDQEDGTQSEPVWQKTGEFTLDTALTNYHVLVRYSEGTNYEASDPSRADSKFFFAGNVTITVHGVDGVIDTVKAANPEEVDVVTGVRLTLRVEDGYYFPKDYTIKKIDVAPVENGPLTAVLNTSNTDPKILVFDINGIKKDSNIDIYLNHVKKLLTIESYVTEGQIFVDFEDTNAVISRDSAYTARFVVENFDKEVYSGKFVFDGLPAGTPLILMKKTADAITYYRAIGPESGELYLDAQDALAALDDQDTPVILDKFVEMGTSSTCFSWQENEQDFILQLVVAFSGVNEDAEVKTELVFTPKMEELSDPGEESNTEEEPGAEEETGNGEEPDVGEESNTEEEVDAEEQTGNGEEPDAGEESGTEEEPGAEEQTIVQVEPNVEEVKGEVITDLEDIATFNVVGIDNRSVTLSYTPSDGTASIWYGRDNALVLKAAEGTILPEDAKLTYTDGFYNWACSMNAAGLFVIPLGSLRLEDITLSFELSTKMKAGTYDLDAIWYVACSQAETAPMNGDSKGTARITLSAEKANVSLKITEEQHLYSVNDILSVQVDINGTNGYTTKLDIQQKIDGSYQSVDVARTINESGEQMFNLNFDPGSYRLYLYAYTSYSREETSFYFIIQ